MSATARDARLPQDLDPGRVFDLVVIEAGRVCRRCLTLLNRYDPLPNETGDKLDDIHYFVGYDLPNGYKHDIVDREYFMRVPFQERTDTLYHEDGRSRYCKNCGTTATPNGPSAGTLRRPPTTPGT